MVALPFDYQIYLSLNKFNFSMYFHKFRSHWFVVFDAIVIDFLNFIRHDLIERRNKTVILTTHILSEITEIADNIAVLAQGQIQTQGSLEELNATPGLAGTGFQAIYDHYVK